MGIETREVEITYDVWNAIKKMAGIVLYQTYSDPSDMHGTGLATMETSYNFGDNYFPVIRAKTTWKLDQDWHPMPDTEISHYYMTVATFVEDDDQYDYPNGNSVEYGQITDASPDGC